MIDYIDLLLGEQLERQEREETGGTWNGETVRVPVPQPEDGEEVLTADSMAAAEQKTVRAKVSIQKARQAQAERQGAEAEELNLMPAYLEEVQTKQGSHRQETMDEGWTVRRWVSGQAQVNRASVRMAEGRQAAREVGRADLLPDAIQAGQWAEERQAAAASGYAEGVGKTMEELSQEKGQEPGTSNRSQSMFDGAWMEPRQLGGSSVTGIQRGSSGVEWLDQAVRFSLEGLPAPERESKVVTLEPAEWNGGVGRLELQRLDRLVRRDARRFDGGFQLL